MMVSGSGLITYDDALSIIARQCEPLGVEITPIGRAGRRVLARDLHAVVDAPRTDVSAMDGYALRRSDLETGLRAFTAVGVSYPTVAHHGLVTPGGAVRIMTGAAMPPGLDTVIPVECVTVRDHEITLCESLEARPHVRARASDIRAGDVLLRAGCVLDPRAILVAAAGDHADLPTFMRPRVRILTCGDELVPPGGAAVTADRIPDSLSEALLLMARQWGGRPDGAALVGDDREAIREAADAASEYDVLVIAGGASGGDRDFCRPALGDLGMKLLFAGLAVKPGKPTWYGRLGATHVIGLPGNPTAALTLGRLLLVPLLTALGGRGYAASLRWRGAELGDALPPADTREQFLCGWHEDGVVTAGARQEASAQLTLARTNVLVRRAASAIAVATGEMVEVLSL